MITDFKYITESGLKLKVSLGTGDSLFEYCSQEELMSYYSSNSCGLSWIYKGKEIIFYEEGQYLLGYPTPYLERVILIYSYNHSKYGAPQNLVIYNVDGTIYMQIRAPELISPIAKDRKSRKKNYNLSDSASFRGIYWSRDSHGNLITVVTIDFDWEWWESRVLNPDTGEFGECISSGRR